MNYGLYISAGGMLTAMHRTDVASNNLANVETTAFKTDFAAVRHRLPERQEDNLPFLPSNELLERLGGGVLVEPTRTDFSQAPLEKTDNPLDVAIEGRGFFVTRGHGEGEDAVRLTRDGRFTVSPDGRLVRSISGAPILSDQGAEIRLRRDATVQIDERGRISQDGDIVATLQLVEPADLRQLRKEGADLFRFRDGATPALNPASGVVYQGMLERSGVDPVKAMLAVSKATGAIERNARMLDMQDRIVRSGIAGLGRIA